MRRTKVLFICGSINQTTQMHAIAERMPEVDAWFTPFYVSGVGRLVRWCGLLETSIGGHKLNARCRRYLDDHGLPVDFRGARNAYDLVVTCTDQVLPSNILRRPIVLVQEGMLDPVNALFRLRKVLRFIPRWAVGTAATGLSFRYERICVASHGYREYFIRHGVDPTKIAVTGIPNFDDCERYRRNDFPHRGYCLVCTSDARETSLKRDDRRGFIERCKVLAKGRPLVFKLHPAEWVERAEREIHEHAPGSLIYRDGAAEEMVANADVVVVQYSSLAFVAMALGKEVHSYFDRAELARLLPIQNRGESAANIAAVCREVLALAGARADRRLRAPVLRPSAERSR